jgi:hypothetical protein
MASISPSRPPVPDSAAATVAPALSGWVYFSALLFCILGGLNLVWGLTAVLNDEVLTVGGQGVLIADFTTWGWVHMVLGVVMLAVGFGLYAKTSWSRAGGLLLATLNLFAQMVVITAFPLWAVVVIALDVIVIFGLTARWND